MRRTQIQVDEEMHERLREEAHARRTSMAAVVRDILRHHLGLEHDRFDAPTFSFVGAGRSDQKDLAPVSEHHDEALAEAGHPSRS
jgi:hypothetical protein